MSTRCHIVFRQNSEWKDSDGVVNSREDMVALYKHHDGYPSNIVPLLRRYYDYARERSNDLEYFAGTFPYYWKRKLENRRRHGEIYRWLKPISEEEDSEKSFEVPSLLTGMGICPRNHVHSDAEYLWVVDLNMKEIRMWRIGYTSDIDACSVEEIVESHSPDGIWNLLGDSETKVSNDPEDWR